MTIAASTKPKLGFLGVGWIGRARLEALARSGAAEVAAVADPALEELHGLPCLGSLDELLERDLDGVVIATPSALHAEQTIAALDHRVAVFCQKPLGLDAGEAGRAVDAARRADRLLVVDLSYRTLNAARAARRLVEEGSLGRVFAADLCFDNAYGPDKAWFYEPELAGGGCVIDLGTHLVDLVLWLLDFPRVEAVESRLFRDGARLARGARACEDYAVVQLDLAGGIVVRLQCSWRLHAGRDCVIRASVYGTDGAVAIRNVDGSFYDFVGELHRGTATEVLSRPPEDWGGRALVEWSRRLAAGDGFDPAAEQYVASAEVIDRIYGRAP